MIDRRLLAEHLSGRKFDEAPGWILRLDIPDGTEEPRPAAEQPLAALARPAASRLTYGGAWEGEDPVEELEDLRAFKDDIESTRARWWGDVAVVWVWLRTKFISSDVETSIRDWRRARKPLSDPLPEPESSALAAAILHRFVRVTAIGFVVALVPFTLSILGVVFSCQANTKLDRQNALVASQNAKFDLQNTLVGAQNELAKKQNAFFQQQITEQAAQSKAQLDLQIEQDYQTRKAFLVGVIYDRALDTEKVCPSHWLKRRGLFECPASVLESPPKSPNACSVTVAWTSSRLVTTPP